MGEPSAAAGAADPLLGKVLNGRFTILEPLGVGGMGRVYKALQAPLDRLVALKVLNPHYGGGKDPGFQKRFFLEASLTSKLHHPNTITVHDYGRTDDGIYYIAMEYVEGQTLGSLLQKEGKIPWPRALHIAQQICRSLREAHKFGIIHRDLKPANVMLLTEETDNDMVKVLDFGLVKSFMPDHAKTAEETELTQAGVLLGSPLYMAPEQARNEGDPRSDVYSLGVVLYQMLAGRPPFQGKESIDVIVKHIREKVPPIKSFAEDLPDEVEGLILKMLEKDPGQRYQTMDEVLEAMRSAASAQGLSGAWSNPRSMLFSGARAVTPSKVEQIKNTPHPADPGSTRVEPSRSGRVKIDIDLDADSGVRAPPSNRKTILIGGSLAALVIGGIAAAAVATRKPDPPAPVKIVQPSKKPDVKSDSKPDVKPAVDPPKSTVPTAVTFKIDSVPQGAHVSYAGRDLGPTPTTLRVPASAGGSASAELSFALDGYQPQTFTASGEGPEVSVNQKLVKKKFASKPPPVVKPNKGNEHPNGYKDDPYQ